MIKEKNEGMSIPYWAFVFTIILCGISLLGCYMLSYASGYTSGYSDGKNAPEPIQECPNEEIDYGKYPHFEQEMYFSLPEGDFCLTKVNGGVSNLYALIDEQKPEITKVGWIDEYNMQNYKKCIYGKDVLVEPENVRHTVDECLAEYEYCIVGKEGFYYGFEGETEFLHPQTINEGGLNE